MRTWKEIKKEVKRVEKLLPRWVGFNFVVPDLEGGLSLGDDNYLVEEEAIKMAKAILTYYGVDS